VLERIAETNAEIAERNGEINELRAELGVLDGKIYQERKEIERLDHDHRDAVNVSHKNYQEIARLKDLIAVRELDNRQFQARLQALEQEVESNTRRIQHLSEARDQKDQDIHRAQQKIGQEQLSIGQLKNQNAQLDKDIQYFESVNYKHQQTQIALSKANEQEYFRGKDLLAAEAERRAIHKARDEELTQLKLETDHVKHSNARYLDDSHELQSQIDSLNRHVALLNQQNYELSVELEKFIETDEQVRKTLNRKGKVEDIRHKVDEAIARSMNEIQRTRSPERGSRDSPNRR
jgi:chromosome segregation ATPase